MPDFSLRPITPQDIPQAMALQAANQRLHPQAEIVNGDLYLSQGPDDELSVFCVFDKQEKMRGYISIYPQMMTNAATPHLTWGNIKVYADDEQRQVIRDLLFEQILKKAKQIIPKTPNYTTRLMFELHTSETESIEYITAKGFAFVETTLRMTYDLGQKPKPVPKPSRIKVKNWKIEKETEQAAYVAARNEAFPLTPIRLVDAQTFLRSIINKCGTTVTAFDGKEIVGGVNAYWIEDDVKLRGKATGWTENIFVRKAWEGRGIASYLICRSLLYLKEHGIVEARLDTGSQNKRAQGVYARLGYTITGEKHQYALNYTGEET